MRSGAVLLFDLEGDLSFGAAPELERHLSHIEWAARDQARVVVLFLKRARNPDAAFLGLLGKFQDRLQQRQIALVLGGAGVELVRGLRATGLEDQIGAGQIVPETFGPDTSTRDAIRRAHDLLCQEVDSQGR